MTTSWQYATSESFSNVLGSVDLNHLFSRQVIAIDVASPQKKATWDKAGNILQLIDLEMVPNFFTRLEVSDSYSYLGFNPTLFRFQILSGNEYRIRFKPVTWQTNFTITVWEYLGD
jgi:hypothetical protein